MSTKKNTSIKEFTGNLVKLIKYRTGIEKPPKKRNRNIGLIVSGAASVLTLGTVSVLLNNKLRKKNTDADDARFNISNPPTTSGAANANKPPKEEEVNLSKEKK
ncbi:MAG: hypothetical protein ACOCXH_02250 [Cyclobacteriaceae bacterium]